jgi:predicted DNA-binding antitoxin AbrB/MazE fold protein
MSGFNEVQVDSKGANRRGEMMSHMVTAIYEQGVLHPLTPLNLSEHQRVSIEIVPENPQETIKQTLQMLSKMGRLTPPRRQAQEVVMSEAERVQLSRKLGKGIQKPLSEIILEERGER